MRNYGEKRRAATETNFSDDAVGPPHANPVRAQAAAAGHSPDRRSRKPQPFFNRLLAKSAVLQDTPEIALGMELRGRMPAFADKQYIYEINTWVWLTELSQQAGRRLTLDQVPAHALDELARPGIDAVWLMGVWQRSPFGRQVSLKWKHEYLSALPDMTDSDVIGSAYAIGDYRVDDRLGGREALAALRQRLHQRGLKLILDYVPNHVACDHAWVREEPDFIVQGSHQDLITRPSDFFTSTDATGHKRVFAHGRDPYFPGWSDTAQLNIFNPELRAAVRRVLLEIAAQCDGVRCDMAMLMMREIFASTWAGFVGGAPEQEYWMEMIPAVRAQFPEFLFIAEVYWHREYDLLMQGFDLCYDKVFYDRLRANDVQQLRQHLVAELAYQQRLLRFIENHDEARAFEAFGPQRSKPAATLLCTLPGGTLLHDGQFTGRRAKLPVQIARAPEERRHADLEAHYLALLRETENPVYQHGHFYLFQINPVSSRSITHLNLLAYGWTDEKSADYRLILVNMTEHRSQGRIDLSPWGWLRNRRWQLFDVLSADEYERQGGALTRSGLFGDLEPHESLILRFELEPQPEPEPARPATQ